MLLRVTIIVLGGGFVAYRVALAREIIRAKRAGDIAREQRLRRSGFGLHRWAFGALVVFVLFLVLLIWANSR
jgi:hypothetical protein